MPRRPTAFRPEALRLEDRQLLSARSGPPLARPPSPPPPIVSLSALPPVVSHQADSATILVNRGGPDGPTGTLQVRVVTVPSPGVGVNLPAVDRTVTFADGEGEQRIAIPIHAGAPNPGEVDVALAILPVSGQPDVQILDPTILRIKASDDVTPPMITGSRRTRQGVELTFSEPMDPAGVQDVRNFHLWEDTGLPTFANSSTLDAITGGILNIGTPFAKKTAGPPKPIPLRAAIYDPATLTVTLIPTRPISTSMLTVTKGFAQGNRSQAAAPLPPIADAANNEIEHFTVGVSPGRPPRLPGNPAGGRAMALMHR